MRRVVRWSGTTFITTGLLILLFALYELVGTSIITNGRQRALAEDFREQLAQPVPTASATPTATPRPAKSGANAIARIHIPKIAVDDIVVEGVTLSNLAYGPGHYPTSAKIGQKGAAAIAGHRTGWGSPFIRLDELRKDDEIVLETTVATYTYRVTRTTVVNPEQTSVLRGDPRSKAMHKLVVTTCTPKYTSRRRLIIWADLVVTVPRST
jgi:sortase A